MSGRSGGRSGRGDASAWARGYCTNDQFLIDSHYSYDINITLIGAPTVVATTENTGVQTRSAWQIDPAHSLVEFSGKHMMFATVKGRFQTVKGEVLWDEANPEASTVTVEIDVASLTSGSEQRDGHLKSPDFLEVEKYPTIRFESVRVEPRDADRA